MLSNHKLPLFCFFHCFISQLASRIFKNRIKETPEVQGVINLKSSSDASSRLQISSTCTPEQPTQNKSKIYLKTFRPKISLKEVWPVEPKLLFCVHSLGFHHLKKCCVFMNSVFWHFKSTLQPLVPFKYLLMLTRNGNMFSFHYFTVNTSAYILKKMNTQ